MQVGEQVNKDSRTANSNVNLESIRLQELFHQITHDIRVPVTGLKMLWPMLDEVDETEKEEVSRYLKSSSYELFDLIENLTLVLIDFELLSEETDLLKPDEILTDIISKSFGQSLSKISSKKTHLRKQHFLRCLEVSTDICQQLMDNQGNLPIKVETGFSSGYYRIRFSGPSIFDSSDKYSTDIHYSLFNRARGNSKISGFSMLRLRNLMTMIRGSLMTELSAEATQLVLSFPSS